MRIRSRRLALFVIAATVLVLVTVGAIYLAISVRQTASFLGLNGFILFYILAVVWVVLLIDGVVLAVRDRMATKPEIVVLMVLAGLILFVALTAAAEPLLNQIAPVTAIAGLVVAATGWAAILLATLGTLIAIIVGTVRAPQTVVAEATRSEPSESADPTP